MPKRAAPPSEGDPLEALPAAPVGLVPALPDVVGPAVPAVERTVPLLEFVAYTPLLPVPDAAPEMPVARVEAPVIV